MHRHAIALACAFPFIGPLQAASVVTVDAGPNVGQGSSIAIGADGLPRIAYRNSSNNDLLFATCSVPDCSSSTHFQQIDGARGEYSSLAIRPNGNPLLAYYDSTVDSLAQASCHADDCSGIETLRYLDDSADDTGRDVSLAIDIDGRPVAAYVNTTNHSLQLVRCQTNNCDNVTITVIDDEAAASLGTDAEIALQDGLYPVMAYLDVTEHELRIAICHDVDCTTPPTIHWYTDPNLAGSIGLDLDADGKPMLSFHDTSNDRLQFIRCLDRDCNSYMERTIDDPADGAGGHSDLVVRPNGLPAISYRRGLGGGASALFVAECRDDTCSPGNVDLVEIDSRPGEATGADTAIAVGSDGGVVVSYYDVTNQSLKFARCDPVGCDALVDAIFTDDFEI